MKTMKTVVIPERTETVVDKVICDLCGSEIVDSRHYGVDDVEVSHETGSDYPESRYTEKVKFDICGKCFDNRLVPWLQSQGATPTIEDTGY